MQSVEGGETLAPEKATLLAACKVISQEHPNFSCRSIDVPLTAGGGLQEERLIADLILEFYSDAPDRVIAYRKNGRLVEQFDLFTCLRRLRRGRRSGSKAST